MGMFDKLFGEYNRLSQPEDEEEFEEIDAVETRSLERKDRRSLGRESDSETKPLRQSRSNSYESENRGRVSRVRETNREAKNDRNIVEFETKTLQQVVIMEPREFEDVKAIADYLCSKFTIILNLEQTKEQLRERILDFISGVAYANQGMIRPVAKHTYVVTPYTVNLVDQLMSGLENEGYFFNT